MLVINTDGACFGNPGPMGAGATVYKGNRKIAEICEYLGSGTNNIAEYSAALRALEFAKSLGETEVEIRSDSQLLIRQLKGEYKVKAPHLKELHSKILDISKGMKITYKWVRREHNQDADLLSKAAIEKRGSGQLHSSLRSAP